MTYILVFCYIFWTNHKFDARFSPKLVQNESIETLLTNFLKLGQHDLDTGFCYIFWTNQPIYYRFSPNWCKISPLKPFDQFFKIRSTWPVYWFLLYLLNQSTDLLQIFTKLIQNKSIKTLLINFWKLNQHDLYIGLCYIFWANQPIYSRFSLNQC